MKIKLFIGFDRGEELDDKNSSDLLKEIRKSCLKFDLVERNENEQQDSYECEFIPAYEIMMELQAKRNELNRKIASLKKEALTKN